MFFNQNLEKPLEILKRLKKNIKIRIKRLYVPKKPIKSRFWGVGGTGWAGGHPAGEVDFLKTLILYFFLYGISVLYLFYSFF